MKSPIIDYQDVSLYQRDKIILENISLQVNSGDFIYLIGRTGSGKSSLMQSMYAEIPIHSGKAQLGDYDLTSISSSKVPYLRRSIGIVFQDFHLLIDRTIKDNLLFVLKSTGWTDKKKIAKRIAYVLNKVDLSHKEDKYPYQLSGGEQQRIAIARALLNQPSIIIADEPTRSLDPQTSVKVIELLQEINQKGTTLIIATHDYAMVLKYPSRIFKCEDQRIYEVIPKK